MASVIGKQQNGRTYYYLAESARVGGRPRIVRQRYLGTAADIEAAVESGGTAPASSRHLPFGDVAAAWRVLGDLGVVDVVDQVVGRGRREVSVGTYLALAVLHRISARGAPLDLADWWPTTAAARFVRPRPPAAALARHRLWRALERVSGPAAERIQAALFARVLDLVDDEDAPVLALDLPDFATFVDPEPAGARLTGLALLVTLDGAIPLVSQLYQHQQPDAASFSTLVGRLTDRYEALAGHRAVTVVIGGGQHAQADLGTRLGLHFVEPLPPGERPALGRRPATSLDGLPGVTAVDGRADVFGTSRRVVVVHSKSLHEAQERALARSLGHASRRLDELAAALAQGTHGRSRDDVAAEVARITYFRWGDRVLRTNLTGSGADLRLRWWVDEAARARLHREQFGNQLLVTDHDDWSVADVITAYRARYHLETTLTQLGGPLVANPSPSWQWRDERVAVHALVGVLATTVVHVMRRRAQLAGLDLSVRDLLHRLAGMQETVLRHPPTGGRPRTRRLLTDRDDVEQRLYELFDLGEFAP
ncbi:MAG: transposase [Streptosporangiales bacterium]|nr:transposase [Streptosporangiales bacterium]